MSLSSRLCLALLSLAGLLAGCRPDIEASLSPDGKLVAEATRHGVKVRPIESARAGTLLTKGEASQPMFSPDGGRIAYADAKMHVINVDGSSDVVLPFQAPLVWSPDGSYIAGRKDRSLIVCDTNTGAVKRQISLGFVPERAIWLEGSQAVVVADAGRVQVAGELKPLWIADAKPLWEDQQHGALVYDIGFDRSSKRVYALVGKADGGSKMMPRSKVMLLSIGLDRSPVQVSAAWTADSFGATREYAFYLAGALDVERRRFALSGVVDRSDPGLLVRYAALYDQSRHGRRSPALNLELKSLEKQLKFDAVAVVQPFEGSAREVLRRPNVKTMDNWPYRMQWSQNGRTLLTSFMDAVATRKVDL